MIRYLSHPQVVIDPLCPVPEWGLSEAGRARVLRLAGCRALAGTVRVISSAEVKALETAGPLAAALGVAVEVRERMHENDRSATGYLPGAEFEAVADQFFAAPEVSVRGWERAADAQARIVAEVAACVADTPGGVLIVGHGGVGTFLWCHLAGVPISRAHDQGPGGGGNWFGFAGMGARPASGWQPMETLLDA